MTGMAADRYADPCVLIRLNPTEIRSNRRGRRRNAKSQIRY